MFANFVVDFRHTLRDLLTRTGFTAVVVPALIR